MRRLLRSDKAAEPMPSFGGGGGGGGLRNGRSDDRDTESRLKKRINEYMITGVIDEIVDMGCDDLNLWRVLITNELGNRKSSEIQYVISMVNDLFEQRVFHNKGGAFHEAVVKFLAEQFDDSAVDCPNFGAYVGRLFAHLYNNEYLAADQLFSVFLQHYHHQSELGKGAKTKRLNKLVQASVDELNQLGCEPQYIRCIQKFAI